MKYENNLRFFSKKLNELLVIKKMVDKKGKPDRVALYNALHEDKITESESRKRKWVNDKTRKIGDWLNGNHYPQNVSDVLSVCNALDCDFDYLFTDMETPTHDLEFISQETGLSHTAVSYIQNATEYEQLVLDTILKKGYFWDICYAIYSYMQTYYQEFHIDDVSIENVKLQDSEKMEIAEYRATKHFSNILINKISQDEDIKKYNKYEHDKKILRHVVLSDDFKKNVKQAEDEFKKFMKSGKGGV